MSIDSIHQLGRPSATSIATSDGQQLGRDDFMKLLVTQLKNQDPSNPLDPRESIVQLAQLSNLEQLVQIRDRLAVLEVGSQGMANAQATAMIGRTVTARTDSMSLGSAGSATTSFRLSSPARSITAAIRDERGQTVRTMELGARFVGDQTIVWDGRDDAGDRALSGRYSVEYRAVDANGQPVNVATERVGRVDSVELADGRAELMIGSTRVRLGNVVEVSD